LMCRGNKVRGCVLSLEERVDVSGEVVSGRRRRRG